MNTLNNTEAQPEETGLTRDRAAVAKPIRPKGPPTSILQVLSLVVSACAALAAYSAYQSVKATQVVVERSFDTATDAMKQMRASQEALRSAQERMLRPGRRELVVQVPKGATECRVLVEDSPDGRGYQQNVICK